MPTLECNDKQLFSKLGSRSILNKPLILVPLPIKFSPLKILKVEFINQKLKPITSSLETGIKFLEKYGIKNPNLKHNQFFQNQSKGPNCFHMRKQLISGIDPLLIACWFPCVEKTLYCINNMDCRTRINPPCITRSLNKKRFMTY
jgi:hypothetical protein